MKKTPIILIPGLGGSRLEASYKNSSYHQIWPSIASGIPIVQELWKDVINVKISQDGKAFHNVLGDVDVRAIDFGGLKGIRHLEDVEFQVKIDMRFFKFDVDIDIPIVSYFDSTITTLQKIGYVNLAGAPYDFRRITDIDYLPWYLDNLKSLIERKVEETGEKTILVTHSLGGILSTYFLNMQTIDWKTKHISKLITVGTPFAGATAALETCISGNTENLPISNNFIRTLERNLSGVLWMINGTDVWDGISIINGQDHRGIRSYLERSCGLRIATAWDLWINPLWNVSKIDPEVPVVAIFGTKVKTIEGLIYQGEKFLNPRFIYEMEGDGTVPYRSLNACKDRFKWATIVTHEIPGADHLSILKDPRYVQILKDILG